jgi:hypothetical protein
MYRSRQAFVPEFASPRGNGRPRTSKRRAIRAIAASEIGFHGDSSYLASSRLTGALAATIAVVTLSLGAGVTLAVLSIRAAMALPIPS